MANLPLTIVEFDITNQTITPIALEDFILNTDNKIYWIHCDLNEIEIFTQLAKKIKLPKDVIQLCKINDPIPKFIENKDSLAIQIECLSLQQSTSEDDTVNYGNLIFFLTAKYCFTASNSSIPAITVFEENYPKYLQYAKTPCFVLFIVLDNIINDFSKLLLDFEMKADQIDLKIREEEKNIYSDVMHVKKQIMKIQHHIASTRDLLMRISGRMIPVISDQCRTSLAGLLTHSQIIFSEAEAVREILKSTLDQLDNALMHRMNNTIKILTAFAAVFFPISLIAGIYGMNFHWIPELYWKYGYFWALSLMLICGISLYYWFKKKKWW